MVGCCAGIGFKAVAIISQATYVDSGGFKFLFDVRQESYPDSPELRWLGLVRPTWMEDLSVQMEEWITRNLAGMAVRRSVFLTRSARQAALVFEALPWRLPTALHVCRDCRLAQSAALRGVHLTTGVTDVITLVLVCRG